MGSETKMKNLILLILIALTITGCDTSTLIPPPPVPTVAVERLGAYTTKTDSAIMIITFKKLKFNRGDGYFLQDGSIKITNPQQLRDYKDQIKFLMQQIEDAEDLLKTKEIIQ